MMYASHHHKAFSLVEIVLALGIMAFCMIGIFGLLPVGLTSNMTSAQQTKAAGVASSVAADLRAKNTKIPTQSPRYGFVIPGYGGASSMAAPQTIYTQEDGTPTGIIGAKPSYDTLNQSVFRVTVGFSPPAASKGATMARIMVSWPPSADLAKDPSSKSWPIQKTGAFETVIGLNRN